jgi:hypothetical protein
MLYPYNKDTLISIQSLKRYVNKLPMTGFAVVNDLLRHSNTFSMGLGDL